MLGEIAEIVRQYGPQYRTKCGDQMPPSHLHAMKDIEACRTETLGGHVSQCTACGALEDSSHSCKNRHGPTCQNDKATRWLAKQRALLLPTPSFLVPSPLPDALRDGARAHQDILSTLLFQTASAALKALAMDPSYLGGQIGMIGVLHTGTRERASHPPIHSLGSGGALAPDGEQWLSPRYTDWLVPVKALSKIFRRKCKDALTTAGLLDQVPPQGWKKKGVVHCEPAGTGTAVLTYLAPSIRRIAITTTRIAKLADSHGPFRCKDSTNGEWNRRTLPAEECLRRFLQHVLPKGFITSRDYGFLSPNCRASLDHIRPILDTSPCTDQIPHTGKTPAHAHQDPPAAPEQELYCRKCGGLLVLLGRLWANQSAPP